MSCEHGRSDLDIIRQGRVPAKGSRIRMLPAVLRSEGKICQPETDSRQLMVAGDYHRNT